MGSSLTALVTAAGGSLFTLLILFIQRLWSRSDEARRAVSQQAVEAAKSVQPVLADVHEMFRAKVRYGGVIEVDHQARLEEKLRQLRLEAIPITPVQARDSVLFAADVVGLVERIDEILDQTEMTIVHGVIQHAQNTLGCLVRKEGLPSRPKSLLAYEGAMDELERREAQQRHPNR
jgi:hypothetical protein